MSLIENLSLQPFLELEIVLRPVPVAEGEVVDKEIPPAMERLVFDRRANEFYKLEDFLDQSIKPGAVIAVFGAGCPRCATSSTSQSEAGQCSGCGYSWIEHATVRTAALDVNAVRPKREAEAQAKETAEPVRKLASAQ